MILPRLSRVLRVRSLGLFSEVQQGTPWHADDQVGDSWHPE